MRTEKFVAFFADECTPASERSAFAGAWAYMREQAPVRYLLLFKIRADDLPQTASRSIRTFAAPSDIEELFDPAHAIDLYYDVV